MLHGLANRHFGIVLTYVGGGKSILVEPGQRIVQFHIGQGMAGRKLCREHAVDLRLEFCAADIRRRNTQLLRHIRQRGNTVIGREGNPHVGQADLMPEEIKEIGQFTIEIESHLLHLWGIRPNLVTKDVVGREAD